MELLSMPTELLIRIIQNCGFPEIGRICATCKRIKECADSEAVWRYKWEHLLEHGPFVISLDNNAGKWSYKHTCQRYVAIQRQACTNNNMAAGWRPSTPPCLRECVGWCIYCNQEGLHMAAHQKPDVLALDFGSKTSWVKCNKGSWSCLVSTRTPTQQASTKHPNLMGGGSQDRWAETQVCSGSIKWINKDMEAGVAGPDEPGGIIKTEGQTKDDVSGAECDRSCSPPVMTWADGLEGAEMNESFPCNPGKQNLTSQWPVDIYPQGALLCTCILCDPRIRATCKPCRQDITPPQSCLHLHQPRPYSIELDQGNSATRLGSDKPTLAEVPGCDSDPAVAAAGRNPSPAAASASIGCCTYSPSQGDTPAASSSATSPNDKTETSSSSSQLASMTFVPPVPATGDLWRLVRRLLEKTGGSSSICLSRAICQVSEPTGWDDFHKGALLKMFFEELGVQSLCFVPKASCVAMATGLDCCLVIDSGAHHTTVTAVVDQKVIKGCHTVRQVGGAHISQCLAEVLSDKGLRPELCACELDGREVKSKCYMEHRNGVRSKSNLTPVDILVRSLRHSGGWAMTQLAHELYMAPEVMYLTLDLPSMIQHTITKLPADLQKKLVANIMLTGGNCALTGLASRLQLDLQTTLTELAPWVWVRIRDAYICLRSDAVEGVSYLPRPCDLGKGSNEEGFTWLPYVSREDYIIHGEVECLTRMRDCWEVTVGQTP